MFQESNKIRRDNWGLFYRRPSGTKVPIFEKECLECGEKFYTQRNETFLCGKDCVGLYNRLKVLGTRVPHGEYWKLAIGYEHPYYSMGWKSSNIIHHRWILEHRLVMAEHLGRPLLPHPFEEVHHRNGRKRQNNIGNLELRMGAHGTGVSTCPHCGKDF